MVYGDFSTSPKTLRTNGQFQIGNPAVTGYALPTSRGNSGQLLQTDGVGGTSWVDTANNISIVRTNLSSNQSLGTGGWQKINFATVVFDTKSEFASLLMNLDRRALECLREDLFSLVKAN